MPNLGVYAAVALVIAGLGFYAKAATERAVLAESAADTLARGYEQYERRIKEANDAQKRRDKEWKTIEAGYVKKINEFENAPITECDAAPVDDSITRSLLSSAGHDKGGSGDSANSTGTAGPSDSTAYLSNRGQSEWLAGYQKQLDKCNSQLTQIKTLIQQARGE